MKWISFLLMVCAVSGCAQEVRQLTRHSVVCNTVTFSEANQVVEAEYCRLAVR
jgi:hypothetical protein